MPLGWLSACHGCILQYECEYFIPDLLILFVSHLLFSQKSPSVMPENSLFGTCKVLFFECGCLAAIECVFHGKCVLLNSPAASLAYLTPHQVTSPGTELHVEVLRKRSYLVGKFIARDLYASLFCIAELYLCRVPRLVHIPKTNSASLSFDFAPFALSCCLLLLRLLQLLILPLMQPPQYER